MDAEERSKRGGSGDGASAVRAWCKQRRFCLPTQANIFFSVLLSWYGHTQEPTEKKREIPGRVLTWELSVSDTQTERHTDGDQVKEVLASGVPPKGLELHVNF